MDRIYRTERGARQTRDEKQIICSSCEAELSQYISLLDSRNGRQHRVFRCGCGEITWDDKTAYLTGLVSAQ